ncbi:MAG: anthranilate synthase [Candidatus Synechococcus spongiarum 15L]|uniref:Anthranilate synthase component I n=2 Tax=Candidatus Synechococcus spongiarum TaxID=431041 RepID=A0A1T1CZX2_9SYNE|nr:anthranilate synthase component I family protein [Candidatus Synechococcus spongiarum]KKZ11691.1 MAG: anthranilate synthase [Candidatus Synechococcus spongiarum 15L]OOV34137.1 anthranilate synthase component I [Candidatus Synechococcus spongiarum LMB bulk15N]
MISLEEIRQRASQGETFLPIWITWSADLDTPVSTWLRISPGSPYGVLLESVDGGIHVGRWSVVATYPLWVLESRGGRSVRRWRDGRCDVYSDNPLERLRREMQPYRASPIPGYPPLGQLFGMWGYEFIRWIEPTVPVHAAAEGDCPDGLWMLCDHLLLFDQARRLLTAVSYINLQDQPDPERARADAQLRLQRLQHCMSTSCQARPLAWQHTAPRQTPTTANRSRADFEAAVRKAREHIMAGDVFQLVLSQRLEARLPHEPFAVYRSLRLVNPSPYMAYFNFGNWQLIGSSPEVMVKVEQREDGKRLATLRPIAGTRRRSADPATDAALAEELLADPKERSEHVMLVDLARNDLGRVCQPGTVQLKDLMVVERYSHVMHLVSEVQGRLRETCDPLDVLVACFPAGTVSGAPKIRAMQLIHALEPDRRGPYSGVYGSMDLQGTINMAITIRTVLAKPQAPGQWHISVQAGAGVVCESQPALEYEETMNKARGMLRAINCLEVDHP